MQFEGLIGNGAGQIPHRLETLPKIKTRFMDALDAMISAIIQKEALEKERVAIGGTNFKLNGPNAFKVEKGVKTYNV